MIDYQEFLVSKSHSFNNYGFKPIYMPGFLFDFQKYMIGWGLERGRSALFEDCGLGKTIQQLVWAENIVRHTNRPILILTPLAVSYQTAREGEKFGIECHQSRDGKVCRGITVTNYEKLHLFNSSDFGGVVCDESGCLKSFEAVRRNEIIEFMKKVPYRLLCTATAAPNDYPELGNSSEALGYYGYQDMISRFFINTQNTSDTKLKWRNHGGVRPQWRFRGHAEKPFWKWITSWARACRKPSDLGFGDNGFILPPLVELEHVIEANKHRNGMLLNLPAVGLREQREERRITLKERCEKVVELLLNTGKPALVWCHLNHEGDLLERLIKGSVQVSGSDKDEEKEEKFWSFVNGQARILITKHKIGAWGLNFQHCSHIVTFPGNSFEEYYQGTRRCWRFGQKEQVNVDIVTTKGELGVLKNLKRKQIACEKMFANIVEYMNDSTRIEKDNLFAYKEEVPVWL